MSPLTSVETATSTRGRTPVTLVPAARNTIAAAPSVSGEQASSRSGSATNLLAATSSAVIGF
jgi:hypothetical protein